MTNLVEKHPPSGSESTLSQWLQQAVGIEGLQFKLQVRGNTLHLLCEALPSPDRSTFLHQLLPALRHTALNSLLPADFPPIYQIYVYGGQAGQYQPDWTFTVYLNQLDEHLAQLQQEQHTTTAPSHSQSNISQSPLPSPSIAPKPETGALAVSNRSLARQGNEMAIASYLSETLSDLGIAVRVTVKSIACTINSNVYSTDIIRTASTSKRLWIACQAPYKPDPSLVCEVVTQKLRDLEIEGYRDAVILFQVAGEAQPDWLLRVDLTPPDEMLRDWARWGDLEALQRLVNQAIAPFAARIATASLKESSLHLVCTAIPDCSATTTSSVPNRQQIQKILLPLLDVLAPQGIHTTTIYGQVPHQDAPAWVDWIELPAASHPALADSPLTLALQEDWSAIAFLLHRLLNPDLDQYLLTGGIRLQLLPKQDLLHIMSESGLCPDQRYVSQTIVRFLKQLKLPDVAGVRIYGRRAGQKQPMWSYGADFVTRERLVPEPAPEFAASDAYVNDLITESGDEVVRPDITSEDVQSAWRTIHEKTLHWIQQALIRSQLFVPSSDSPRSLALPGQSSASGYSLAIVWGLVGVLLVVQANWLLENALRQKPATIATESIPTPSPAAPPTSVVSSTTPVETEEPSEFPFADVELPRSAPNDGKAFDSDGFTELSPESPAPQATPTAEGDDTATDSTSANLPYTPQNPAVNLALAQSLEAEPFALNFNSRQFNDKLQLYYRVLEESGPPDVLIVGSSRALRGVDPTALEQALAKMGHGDVRVFNFGINGATAQVIDLLLRQLLTPEQLPDLIIWADGARAFNSNAADVTYNGMIASASYQELAQGSLQLPQVGGTRVTSEQATATPEGINVTLTDSYQTLDRWLSQQFAQVARTHQERDRLKQLIQHSVARALPLTEPGSVASEVIASHNGSLALSQTTSTFPAEYEFVDANGFLSLGVQFNPATYYQKYAKVPGDYDRDYLDFEIAGVQEQALRTVLQYTQQQQIPVAFVNLPMTDEYLDASRKGYEQEFRDHMVRFSLQQPGFSFHDLSEAWLTNYDYFSDPSHLNRYGAYAVSERIAEDARIAWPKNTNSNQERVD